MNDLDQALDAIENALSPAAGERLKRVDSSISALRERRDGLYDKAFPIGGNGSCRDGAALTACGEIDNQIRDLTQAREDLLSGKAVNAEPDVSKAVPRALPPPPPLEKSDDSANPFDGLEAVPSGEEFSKLTDDVFNFGFDRIRTGILKFKRAMHEKGNGDSGLAYSTHTHLGLVGSIANVWSEMRMLIAIARDHRRVVERDVAGLVARIEALEERKFISDAGVWDREKEYPAGSFVSHGGAGWIANVQTKAVRPGDGRLWRLAVKSFKERSA